MKDKLSETISVYLGTKVGVLYFDNSNWHGVIYFDHNYLHKNDFGYSESIPEALLDWLVKNGVKHVRMLISTEVQRIDVTLPDRISYDEGSMLLCNELSILTGTDAASFHCGAVHSSTLGANDNYMLTCGFDHEMMKGFRRQLQMRELIFDGVGSLELAFLAYCSKKYNISFDTFMVFSNTFAFVLPANQHLERIGPMSLRGGTQNAKNDHNAWRERLQKRLHLLEYCNNIIFLAFDDDDFVVYHTLGDLFPEAAVTPVNYDDIRKKLAHLAVEAKINSFKEPLSIVNTHLPRKLFSHFYIALPCIMILMLPFIYWGVMTWVFNKESRRLDQQIKKCLPMEAKYNSAKKKRDSIKNQVQHMINVQSFLVEQRKPLFAFIHIAYFFSKYSRNSVMLYSIMDIGNYNIRINGIYSDPEDGLAMNSKLDEFIKDKRLLITKNRVLEETGGDDIPVLSLEMIINYKDLVK